MSGYRVYDIAKVGTRIYATHTDSWGQEDLAKIAYSDNDGAIWSDLDGSRRFDPDFRLVLYRGELLTVDTKRTELLTISSSGTVQGYPLPFRLQKAFNTITIVGNEVYAISTDGRVFKSNNLKTWREYANLGADLLSISYWAARDQLVISSRGPSADFWVIARVAN